jgi:hypothetical protein
VSLLQLLLLLLLWGQLQLLTHCCCCQLAHDASVKHCQLLRLQLQP